MRLKRFVLDQEGEEIYHRQVNKKSNYRKYGDKL
jgi:hypothetical protein